MDVGRCPDLEGQHDRGILQNDPAEVPDLKAGARVVVEESSVFDYLHVLADGTRQGNTTAAILSRQADHP